VTLLKVNRCSQPLPEDAQRSSKGNGWSRAYAIAIFGMKIGSGQTSVKSWKNELVTPCCHTNYILVIARYEPRLECRLWVSGKHVTPQPRHRCLTCDDGHIFPSGIHLQLPPTRAAANRKCFPAPSLSFDPPTTPFSARPIGLTPRCSMQQLLQQFRRMPLHPGLHK